MTRILPTVLVMLLFLSLLGCSRTSECEGMAKSEWRDKCYMEEAKEKNDPAICDNIAYADWQTMCREQFGT